MDWKLFSVLATEIVLLSYHCGQAQIPIYDVKVENLLKMQEGIGWPAFLKVVKGNDALMRLSNTLENMQTCEIITPTGIKFEVRSPPNSRYEPWSDGCGVRVKDVEASDNGRWRMVANATGGGELTGWSELHVEEDEHNTTTGSINLQDGKTHVQVDLTTLDNSYCMVQQPFSESTLVPGQCRVTLDRTTRAVQGRWNVVLGLPGRVSELQIEKNVAVQTEQLVSGYKEEGSKLHLYCNILHTEKNITFCRFQKNTERTGFNIIDGLSDGSHSYYGEGFAKRECGMTIEAATAADQTVWRCTVGLQEWRGNQRVPSAPMQALFKVGPRQLTLNAMADGSIRANEEERILFVQNDSSFTISCHGDESLAYCWFQHPNGTAFTPVERLSDEERDFWYTGESLQMGDCGITFAHVTKEDAGQWFCHMGSRVQSGVELTDRVTVYVTGPLAANRKEVGVIISEEATLYCHTSNGRRPLDYCRFLSPKFLGINIDSSVTAESPILNRFYFTPERSLDYGDCSLTIKPVLQEDLGEWTCAALLHDSIEESKDTMIVYMMSNPTTLSTAGIMGMVFGIIILGFVLAGAVWFKRGRPIPWRRVTHTNTAVTFSSRFSENSQQSDFTSSPRSSNNSDPDIRSNEIELTDKAGNCSLYVL